jgi:hypothetical protein
MDVRVDRHWEDTEQVRGMLRVALIAGPAILFRLEKSLSTLGGASR